MKTKTILISIFLISLLGLLLCFNNNTYAVVLDDADKKGVQKERAPEREYAPGEVIVKLKEKLEPQFLYSQSYNVRSVAQQDILSNLKSKYNLRDEKPVFEGLHNQLKAKNLSQAELDGKMRVKAISGKAALSPKTAAPKWNVDLLPIYVLKTGQDVLTLCNRLKQDPDVEYAEPDYMAYVDIVPNDPKYSLQWAPKKINAEGAWNITTGSADVVIAVIDTGIYYDHPDLKDNIWTNPNEIPGNGIDDDGNGYVDDVHGYNFAYSDANPNDDHGHGTHVAGIAAAAGNNGIGIAGVRWNCKLMAVKGLASNGSGYYSTLAQCILYAADSGAKVLNNSWGPSSRLASSRTMEEAIDYAYSKNCIIVFAAGNKNDDTAYYSPANYPKVISVAATDQNDAKASFSNYGAVVDVAAPGVNILSTVPASGLLGDPSLYKTLSGTSMACPHVAGLAALLCSLHPGYTIDQIEWLIRQSIDTLPAIEKSFYPGFGRINLLTAAQYSGTAPLLIAQIGAADIDYANQIVHIRGTAAGADFSSYVVEIKKEDQAWETLTSSSVSVTGGELCEWHVTSPMPENTTLRLTVYSADGRQYSAFGPVLIERYIDPELISDVYYLGSAVTSQIAQGIYRAGTTVPFVGKSFGPYKIEWKKDQTIEWRSDGISYDGLEPDYLGRWDTTVVSEGLYEVRLSDILGDEKLVEIVLDSALKEGWPIVMQPFNVQGNLDSSSAHSKISNLDTNAHLEVVTMRTFDSAARIYLHDDNGEAKPGWPKIIDGEMGYSYHPTLADIDNDGIDEILITTGFQTGNSFTNTVYCFKPTGEMVFKRVLTGDLSGDMCREPVIACDLNEDGRKEIIYRHSTGVYVLDAAGNDLPGWPKLITTQGGAMSVDGSANFMTIGYFDDDPNPELVYIECKLPGQSAGYETIHVFNADGSEVSGWPQTIAGRASYDWICCGDMNGDGYDEIAVTGTDPRGNKKLYLFSHDGQQLFEKDLSGSMAFCMMSDLNGDNKSELIFNDAYNTIHAVDASDADLPGWPCTLPVQWFYARLVCDIDGDQRPEVIARYTVNPWMTTDRTRLVVIKSDGRIDFTNPLNDKIIPGWNGSLNYCDIDQDGIGELVLDAILPVYLNNNRKTWRHWNPSTWVFKTNYPYSKTPNDWATYFHDNANTARSAGEKEPVNHPPILDPIGNKEVNEALPLQFTVYATDSDPNTALTYTAEPLPTGATFADNTFTWTPGYDQAGTYNIIFTVSDGSSQTAELITVTVVNVNRPPVLDPIGDKKVDENNKLEFTVSARDPDGDLVKLSAELLPEGAAFQNGVFSWQPSYDQAGEYKVTFTASDGSETNLETIMIKVVNVNRAPIIYPMPDQTIKEGQSWSLKLEAKDSDGDKLYYSFNSWDYSMRGLELTPEGLLTWTPDYYQQGEYILNLIVSDVQNHPDDYIKIYFTVKITVINVNRPPVIEPIGGKEINRLERLRFKVTAKDPDNDPIYYACLDKPKGAHFDIRTGRFTWMPMIWQAGDFKVTFIVKDSYGNASFETITIRVPNSPPNLSPIGDKDVKAGQLLHFKLSAADPDSIDNKMLRFYAEGLPRDAILTPGGIFNWRPGKDQIGAYKIEFYVKDSPGAADSKITKITVR